MEIRNILTIEEWKKQDVPPLEFIKTGVGQFDNLCGGLPKGGISIVSGYSGNGKSFALLHIALNLARNYKVLYISVENDTSVDLQRINESNITFNNDNFYLVSVQYNHTLNYNQLAEDICGAVEQLSYDVFVIDGGDVLIEGTDGASMYENGNNFMKGLMSACTKKRNCIIMSWQLNREAEKKKIEDIGTSDIATSMGVVRYASCVFAVKSVNRADERTWQMRMTKARFSYSSDPINVLGSNKKFNLGGPFFSIQNKIDV